MVFHFIRIIHIFCSTTSLIDLKIFSLYEKMSFDKMNKDVEPPKDLLNPN